MRTPLPIRDGVSPSYVWLPVGSWPSILDFLVARFPEVRAETWISRMAKGEVMDASGLCLTPGSPYRQGACVFYYRELDNETAIPFQATVLYQDAHILVADKPHFLPVIPSGRFLHETLLVRLKKSTGLVHLTPIHRIDRETAGVVVFSHNVSTRGCYQSLFQKREVDKFYEALAPMPTGIRFPLTRRSRMENAEPFICMKEVPGEPNTETHIDVLEERGDLCLYGLRPTTGKKHQLRVHLASLGMPILNDPFYPVALPCKGDDMSSPLQLLARSIAFTDPISGRPMRFSSQRELWKAGMKMT